MGNRSLKVVIIVLNMFALKYPDLLADENVNAEDLEATELSTSMTNEKGSRKWGSWCYCAV